MDFNEKQIIAAENFTIPVVKEELTVAVQKRVTGIVRLEKTVSEHEETVSEDLSSETFEVERVPVGRYVDDFPETRYEGDVMILPVTEEILVTKKQLVLKEEIRISRRREHHKHEEAVTLRAESVSVQRVAPTTSEPASLAERQTETGQTLTS